MGLKKGKNTKIYRVMAATANIIAKNKIAEEKRTIQPMHLGEKSSQ
jgi:hypothetical protein